MCSQSSLQPPFKTPGTAGYEFNVRNQQNVLNRVTLNRTTSKVMFLPIGKSTLSTNWQKDNPLFPLGKMIP